MEDLSPADLTLGEHLTHGLADVARGRVTKVSTSKQLKHHLNTVFGDQV
jgi:hypothetical protein